MIGIYMFGFALFALSLGYPVAWTFGAVALLFGGISAFVEITTSGGFDMVLFLEEFNLLFSQMPFRIYSIMTNKILMAVPLFIFMGIVLQKSNLAQRLLEAMGTMFGEIRGGVAVSTVIVGAMLASSTGVVGASVVAMGVISLPVMLKYHYDKPLACGTICASGTLGQIIPPSIILIILADVFGVAVGDLFKAAVIPSVVLVGIYILYILIISHIYKDMAPALPQDSSLNKKEQIIVALKAIIPPFFLIFVVLGSIFAGIATPTESASVGAVGSLILAYIYRELSYDLVIDTIVEELMTGLPGEKWGFIILSMLIIFVLGFFIDFIEISYIVVPILLPISETIGIDPIWFAILIAMNLQSSFLTPPFGFSLFYLKGVAQNIKTTDIYKGVMPFIILQLLVLATLVVFPALYGF